jgi:hypothetical protein
MELFITPHFCETMYAHYGEQLRRKDLPPLVRSLLQECQECYVNMHSLLVSFEMLTEGLPIHINSK